MGLSLEHAHSGAHTPQIISIIEPKKVFFDFMIVKFLLVNIVLFSGGTVVATPEKCRKVTLLLNAVQAI